MRIFHLARTPPQWLRIAFAALMLAFALNSIAHVTHQHDAGQVSVAHHAVCGYCITFGGLAGEPGHTYSIPKANPAESIPAATAVVRLPTQPETSARPRAPPVS